MGKYTTVVLLLFCVLSSCCKPEIVVHRTHENSVKAVFEATPATFAAKGGKGVIKGILREISPEGNVIKETAISNSDFSISLKKGNSDEITLDSQAKTFEVIGGGNNASFVIEAIVAMDGGTPHELTIHRKGKTESINKLPLACVAEYNVGKTPGVFATSHLNNASGYFAFDDVINACPKGYHTPTRQEAAVIMPLFGPNYEVYLMFDTNSLFENREEAIKVGKTQATYLCDYKSSKGSWVSYALRFKKATREVEAGYPAATDNKLQCAYRYEVVNSHKEGAVDSHLKVTARYLGEDFSGSIHDVAKEPFWNNNSAKDVVRIIPSSIYYHPQKQKEVFGAGAFLWTATSYETNTGFVWTIAYIPKMAYISYNSILFKFGIRPVEDYN